MRGLWGGSEMDALIGSLGYKLLSQAKQKDECTTERLQGGSHRIEGQQEKHT